MLGLKKLGEPALSESLLEMVYSKLWEQDRGGFIDVLNQPLRVVVIVVEVRDVEKIWFQELRNIKAIVTRKNEPRSEVCRGKPWVA